jgi:MFS family permease
MAFLVHEPRRLAGAVPAEGASWSELGAFVRREPKLVALHFLGFPLAALAIYTAGAWTPVFLTRVHHMGVAEIGAVLGVTTGLVGIVGNLVVGAVCDQLTRRGVEDAYYRSGAWLFLIAAPAGVAAFIAPRVQLALVAYGVFVLVGSAFAGTSTASLNVITPTRLRGKMFACFWLWMAIMGAAGPLIAAALTEHVFHDPMKIGWSVAIVMGLSMPLAALSLASNMAGFRRISRAGRG